MRGWIFDVYPDYDSNSMVYWVLTNGGAHKVVDGRFRPRIYVHSTPDRMDDLEGILPVLDAVESVEKDERSTWPGEGPRTVLGVTIGDYSRVEEVARTIDSRGRYRDYTLFDVDLRFSQRYLVAKGLFPMGRVELAPEPRMLESPLEMDYEMPPLTAVDLRATTDGRRGLGSFDDRLLGAEVGPDRVDGDEEDVIRGIERLVRSLDPDIIYTDGGDSFLLPYLVHRADVAGVRRVQLGRDRCRRPTSRGKSYFTYGRIMYKPPAHKLSGRVHLDRSGSFMLSEGGLNGLTDLARLSRTPIQEMSRLSPGSAISAMEVNQALMDGCAIMWKKNLPERFKSAKELIVADRGGFIYEPRVGVFDQVLEVDFASLYPNIMTRFNISPETLMCDCCPEPKRTVPVLGYGICDRRVGLIPRVLRPVIERRSALKRRIRDGVGGAAADRERANLLKWLLVTCLDEDTELPFNVDGRFDIRPIGELVDRFSDGGLGEFPVPGRVEVFGVDEHLAPAVKTVSRVMAFPSPDEMVEIYAGPGKVMLTPDHPCYLLRDGSLDLVRADRLRKGDALPMLPPLYDWRGGGCVERAAVRSVRMAPARNDRVCCLSIAEPLHGFALAGGLLVHNCFGYTGYRNARFGRIECHEAINAYGREIMLRTSEIAEAHGFEILHGIVDSLWLMGPGDGERFCEHVSGHIGIPLEPEGTYRWVVFLPSKTTGVGALNRYYGAFDDGTLKVRGIDMRRSDSCELVRDMQSEMLSLLSSAADASTFLDMVPSAVDIMADYAEAVREHAVPVEKLLMRRRVSKRAGDYRSMNDGLAALTQLSDEGMELSPGETVRYVVTDSRSKDPRKRVVVEQLVSGDEYDEEAYVDLLARASETLFLPFGYTRERMLSGVRK